MIEIGNIVKHVALDTDSNILSLYSGIAIHGQLYSSSGADKNIYIGNNDGSLKKISNFTPSGTSAQLILGDGTYATISSIVPSKWTEASGEIWPTTSTLIKTKSTGKRVELSQGTDSGTMWIFSDTDVPVIIQGDSSNNANYTALSGKKHIFNKRIQIDDIPSSASTSIVVEESGVISKTTLAALGITNANYYVDQTPDNGSYNLLAGSVNGTNKVFTVYQGSYVSGTLIVYRNGVAQTQGLMNDFQELSPASGTFVFRVAPAIGNAITVQYLTVGGVTSAGIATKEEGSLLTNTLASLNFTGAGVSASASGGAITVDIPGGGGGASFAQIYAMQTLGL